MQADPDRAWRFDAARTPHGSVDRPAWVSRRGSVPSLTAPPLSSGELDQQGKRFTDDPARAYRELQSIH